MDRRTFLKTLASLGASIALPFNLATASTKEVDAAWQVTTNAWGLFEVNDYGTLSFANFEPPTTRRDAYWYSGASEFDADEIEQHWSLNERIKDLYRDALIDEAENDPLVGEPDLDAIVERVEESWAEWFKAARGADEAAIEAAIDDWLDEEPDWSNEWEALYKSGTAQGAAYDHFLREDPDVMDALGIVVIEGDCPGSSYFAAELRESIEYANFQAEKLGAAVRFISSSEES